MARFPQRTKRMYWKRFDNSTADSPAYGPGNWPPPDDISFNDDKERAKYTKALEFMDWITGINTRLDLNPSEPAFVKNKDWDTVLFDVNIQLERQGKRPRATGKALGRSWYGEKRIVEESIERHRARQTASKLSSYANSALRLALPLSAQSTQPTNGVGLQGLAQNPNLEGTDRTIESSGNASGNNSLNPRCPECGEQHNFTKRVAFDPSRIYCSVEWQKVYKSIAFKIELLKREIEENEEDRVLFNSEPMRIEALKTIQRLGTALHKAELEKVEMERTRTCS